MPLVDDTKSYVRQECDATEQNFFRFDKRQKWFANARYSSFLVFNREFDLLLRAGQIRSHILSVSPELEIVEVAYTVGTTVNSLAPVVDEKPCRPPGDDDRVFKVLVETATGRK